MESSDRRLELRFLRKQLAQFSRLEIAPPLGPDEASHVRRALLIFNDWSDYQTLGVCADDLSTAQSTVTAYVAALGCPVTLNLEPCTGPVYLKFNTLNKVWYLEDYSGRSRGVLISFHASEPEFDEVNGTYGPFPLDLFS